VILFLLALVLIGLYMLLDFVSKLPKRREPAVPRANAPRTDPPKPSNFVRPRDLLETRVAVHEAGHAIVAWSCTHVTEVHWSTIEKQDHRAGSVSYSVLTSDDGDWCTLAVALAGVAAENFVFGNAHSTPAKDDLVKARDLATRIATRGARPGVPWDRPNGQHARARNAKEPLLPFRRLYIHPLTQDEHFVLEEAYLMARHIVRASDPGFHELVQLLLTRKSVKEHDIARVLGSRAFIMASAVSVQSGQFSARPAFIPLAKTRRAS
jgi:hypothetical protein